MSGATNRLWVRSRQLETALRDFLQEAAQRLMQDTAAGAEVPFEVVARPSRLHRTPLYCYRPLTGAFIRERTSALAELGTYAAAWQLLADSDGVDRYLASRAAVRIPEDPLERAQVALGALLEEVFEDQSDFELRADRVERLLSRFEEASLGGDEQLQVVATLHGMALASSELALTRGLTLAHTDALRGAPEEAMLGAPGDAPHLLAVLVLDDEDPGAAVIRARAVLRDLLRSLRLFGDARVTLGSMAWVRAGGGSWRPFVLGGGGRPRGMLIVAPEQEDELRAFCNLVSRRAPVDNELAWALARFEMGCERDSDHEALSDYLLALRALLEPEGPASGLLAPRVAALCAVPERRPALAERVAQAIALEQAVRMGTAGESAGGDALVQAIGDHLRALLRDVICGHLHPALDRVADDLLDDERAQGEQFDDEDDLDDGLDDAMYDEYEDDTRPVPVAVDAAAPAEAQRRRVGRATPPQGQLPF